VTDRGLEPAFDKTVGDGYIEGVAFSPDDRYLATAEWRGEDAVRVWQLVQR